MIKLNYTSYQIKKWERDGYLDSDELRIGIKYLKEVKDKDYTGQAIKLKIPILIIHGAKDDVVPINENRRLFRLLKCPKTLLTIKKGDHDLERFDVKQRVIEASVNWFLEKL